MREISQSEKRQVAEMIVANPEYQAATAIRDRWAIGSKNTDALDVTEFEKQLHNADADIVAGTDAHLKRMLLAQLETLNSLFYKMIDRINRAKHVDVLKNYTDLALLIQQHARRTTATLVDIQRPRRTTFVKQANIAENQQINNYTPDFFEKNGEFENQVSEHANVKALDDRTKEAAREQIHRWKPWEKSTGPKSPEGKRAAAMRGLKAGDYAADSRAIKRMIAEYRRALRQVKNQIEA